MSTWPVCHHVAMGYASVVLVGIKCNVVPSSIGGILSRTLYAPSDRCVDTNDLLDWGFCVETTQGGVAGGLSALGMGLTAEDTAQSG